MAYREFIISKLSPLVESLLQTRTSISILEVGPGPKSTIGRLPGHLRRRVSRYAGFKPNKLFAWPLRNSLLPASEGGEQQLPCLESEADIRRVRFPVEDEMTFNGGPRMFDLILFCHSMYGMADKQDIIKHALGLLREESGEEMVVVFHRDGNLSLDGLACRQMVVFPMGIVHVRDDDEVLDAFADFVAGSSVHDTVVAKELRESYRKTCRALGGRSKEEPGHLSFSSPQIMVTFEKKKPRTSLR